LLNLASFFVCILIIVLSFSGRVFSFSRRPIARSSTWSIVAVDPISGDIGAAGASCVPVNASVLAALVPGKGAAAVQAEFLIQNRDRVFELLQEGLPAETIIEMMTTDSDDTNLGLRQYGIVTFDKGTVQAGGFTGEGNFAWASDQQDIDSAVSVQGNTLESEDVIGNAMAAFSAEDIGPVLLSDRLIRALEAGSAAGGDKRCNSEGWLQTALSAFVAVVRSDGVPFAAPFTPSTELAGPNIPWIYFSVIEEPGGPNPIADLRRQYDLWRDDNIPHCPECDLQAIAIPPGGPIQNEEISTATQSLPTPEVLTAATPSPLLSPLDLYPRPIESGAEGYPMDSSTGGLDLLAFLVILVVLLILGTLLLLWWRRRQGWQAQNH
jgi:uncharacterized Ntn-hydrolase superfamily protein